MDNKKCLSHLDVHYKQTNKVAYSCVNNLLWTLSFNRLEQDNDIGNGGWKHSSQSVTLNGEESKACESSNSLNLGGHSNKP